MSTAPVAPKTQTRGHCQCCGREQAVLASGKMSKHGYTVEHGWFNGVCSGQRYAPIEIDRKRADMTIAEVAQGVADLRRTLAALKEGRFHPRTAKTGRMVKGEKGKYESEEVPFAEAPARYQEAAQEGAIWATENRIRAGLHFIDGMTNMIAAWHGKPLTVIEIADGPAPLLKGDRRTLYGKTVTLSFVQGSRAYYVTEKNTQGWVSTTKFRGLKSAE